MDFRITFGSFGIPSELKPSLTKSLINLKVELVEQLGSDNLVYGQLKNKNDFCYRCPGNQKIENGTELNLQIDENKYYIFDKSSGKRVN